MTRKEPMKVGNVYKLNDGALGMVVHVFCEFDAILGKEVPAAKLRMQDGQHHLAWAEDLRDCPFLGLPKRTFQKRLSDGRWHERFQVEDGPSFTNTSEGYASLPEARVAAWEATYAPPPEPEPEEPQVDHRLTRAERIQAGRDALRYWGRSPSGLLFYARVWGEMERRAQPQGDEYFTEATAREVRDYLREHGGWRNVKRLLVAP